MPGARSATLFLTVLALGAVGCPLLVEDDFVIAPTGDGTTVERGGAAGSTTGVAGVGAAGTGGAGAMAGNAGASGAPPVECSPCADGELCRSDGDCASGRCSGAGTCRACGLRLTSVQAACPASCTRCEGGTCYIECASDDACKEATLDCPPNLACQVVCAGAHACEGAFVRCASEFPCDVACTGKQACKSIVASCGGGPCALDCAADAACKDASLHCGDDRCEAKCATGAEMPQVACGPSCGCTACGP